jgi:hypothetical protein
LYKGYFEAMIATSFIRRYRGALAYALLAGAIAFSIVQSNNHSEDARRALAIQTRSTLIAGCNRNNELRKTLQDLIGASAAQIEGYIKDGTLSEAQGAKALANSRAAFKKVAPIDCNKLYGAPR